MSFREMPIGLALALETIAVPNQKRIDDNRIIPTSNLLDNVTDIYFDAYSITREIINAIPSDKMKVTTQTNVTVSVINVLTELLEYPELSGVMSIVNSYSLRYKVKEHLIVPSTETMTGKKQILLQQVMQGLTLSRFEVLSPHVVVNTPTNNVLYFSHHAYWLSILHSTGKTILMLEGHTGKILEAKDLNKKYKKYPKNNLPFNKRLLIALGDSNTIKGLGKDDVKEIKELTLKWNTNTSNQIVITVLRKYKI